MDGVTLVTEYYRTIDEDEYGSLTELLSAGFVHQRPDRTIEGRDEFVTFMQRGRPERETTHDVGSVYVESGGGKIAAEGRLLDDAEQEWFRFVDTFELAGSRIETVQTYTDADPE
ncbi:MAG: nuclear transport factor 2 family protein [Halobacteriota archaeon]|uniref:nuclear transport factor 2 family protein n=1 Tax=Natronomonas sp. TaxID=2184060 RepID=UPI0039758E64